MNLKEFRELLEEKKFGQIKEIYADMNEFDISVLIGDLPINLLKQAFRLLPKDIASDVFANFDINLQQDLIVALTSKEAVDIIEDMYSDDAADLFEEMSAGVVQKMLGKCDKSVRDDINALLKYPKNSAGSLMSVEYIHLKMGLNIKQSIERIRKQADEIESFDNCFVTDNKRKLLGAVSVKDLLINNPFELIDDIMVECEHTITTLMDQEDVVKVFHNGTHYWALFLDGNGNPLVNTNVTYNINGVFYTRTTNASGWCKLNINLEKGKYILTAINPVTGEMRSNNVTVFTLIETSDLTKYYHNASQFVGRVRAADGNWAGAGEAVTFNIDGVFYTRYTNGTGHFKLNINLDPGDYIITSYYKDCREGNSIKVLPVLIVNDMTMKQCVGSQFVARLVDGQGKPLANQHIHFNIHGVLYDRLTDSNGESRLNINLQAGEYLITSSYNGHNVGSTITVTS